LPDCSALQALPGKLSLALLLSRHPCGPPVAARVL
jgi:hypothetical protein